MEFFFEGAPTFCNGQVLRSPDRLSVKPTLKPMENNLLAGFPRSRSGEFRPGLSFQCLYTFHLPVLAFDEKFLKRSGVSPTYALATRKEVLHRTSENGDLSLLAKFVSFGW